MVVKYQEKGGGAGEGDIVPGEGKGDGCTVPREGWGLGL